MRDDGKYSGDGYYRAIAKTEECVLVPEDERTFIVEHTFRNTMYYKKELDAEFQEYLDYIDSYTKGDIFEQSSEDDDTEEEKSYVEGITKHDLYEHKTRNNTVVQRAKEIHRQRNNGTSPCEVCGFDFAEVYGDLGDDFIEAHHNQPHAEQGVRAVKASDFFLVCANCHRMLHKDRNLTVSELKKLLNIADRIY